MDRGYYLEHHARIRAEQARDEIIGQCTQLRARIAELERDALAPTDLSGVCQVCGQTVPRSHTWRDCALLQAELSMKAEGEQQGMAEMLRSYETRWRAATANLESAEKALQDLERRRCDSCAHYARQSERCSYWCRWCQCDDICKHWRAIEYAVMDEAKGEAK